jgi:hypothetical protein
MALRKGNKPDEGVYFVCPLSSAVFAASMICWGVLKSGSPTPKEITFSPACFIAFAFADIARVRDGEIAVILFAILFFICILSD